MDETPAGQDMQGPGTTGTSPENHVQVSGKESAEAAFVDYCLPVLNRKTINQLSTTSATYAGSLAIDVQVSAMSLNVDP